MPHPSTQMLSSPPKPQRSMLMMLSTPKAVPLPAVEGDTLSSGARLYATTPSQPIMYIRGAKVISAQQLKQLCHAIDSNLTFPMGKLLYHGEDACRVAA